ncbi:unnamed protein product [Timema podura]|uniref:Prenyltransferase alpha-alpha toroid domain-containing protein n=1 Tax=Timema podura TaxID=61482 RepID=A0ABN7PIV4_TIMPD|nr:unnamed protein product [Timema podura]
MVEYVKGLQQPDGSFCGDKWGEVDTRFSFCAVLCLSLLFSSFNIRVDITEANFLISLTVESHIRRKTIAEQKRSHVTSPKPITRFQPHRCERFCSSSTHIYFVLSA